MARSAEDCALLLSAMNVSPDPGMSTMSKPVASEPSLPPVSVPSRFRQFYVLTKPRVVQLIVFCAVIGMLLAVPGVVQRRRSF